MVLNFIPLGFLFSISLLFQYFSCYLLDFLPSNFSTLMLLTRGYSSKYAYPAYLNFLYFDMSVLFDVSNHWEDLRELVEHWSPTFICYPVVRFSDTELLYMCMFYKIYSCSKFQPLKITRLLSSYSTGRCPRCWIWHPFSISFRF